METNVYNAENENISDSFMANRRWLSGKKNGPFYVMKFSLYPNFFPNEMAKIGGYSLQKKDDKIIFFNELNKTKLVIELKGVSQIKPIEVDKYLFFVTAENNHLYTIDETCFYQKITKKVLSFKSAFHGFKYNDETYVVCGADARSLNFFILDDKKFQSVFADVDIILTRDNKQIISTITSLKYGDNECCILACTFHFIYMFDFSGFIKNYRSESFNQTNLQIYIKDISSCFKDFETSRSNYFSPPFLSSNGKFVSVLTDEKIFITPTQKLFSSQSNETPQSNEIGNNLFEEEQEIQTKPYVLSLQKLSAALKTDQRAFYGKLANLSVPYVLTKHHFVTFSTDFVLAISLETGKVAIRYRLGSNILSISPNYHTNSFYILTNNQIFHASFKNEQSPASVLPVKEVRNRAFEINKPCRNCTVKEIVLHLLQTNEFSKLASFLKILLKEKGANEKYVKTLIIFLINEMLIFQTSNTNSFVPYYNNNQDLYENDNIPKAIYMGQLRQLSQNLPMKLPIDFFEACSLSNNSANYLFSQMIENGFYELAIKKIKESNFSNHFCPELNNILSTIAIKSPTSFDVKSFINNISLFSSLVPILSGNVSTKDILTFINSSLNPIYFQSFILAFFKNIENGGEIPKNADDIFFSYLKEQNVIFSEPFGLIMMCKAKMLYKTAAIIAKDNRIYYLALECAELSNNHILKKECKSISPHYFKIFTKKSEVEGKKFIVNPDIKKTPLLISKEIESVNEQINITSQQINQRFEHLINLKESLNGDKNYFSFNKSNYNDDFNYNNRFNLRSNRYNEFNFLYNNNWENKNKKSNENDKSYVKKRLINCSFCRKIIYEDEYIEMPCNHIFHFNCAKYLMTDLLDKSQSDKIKILDSIQNKTIDQLDELNDILTQDCPLCGLISVNQISMPLVGENQAREWDIREIVKKMK